MVTFDEIPKVLLDATTAVEDKTFWENAGFDPVGDRVGRARFAPRRRRGASTITQQLVRARLLDPELVQDPNRTVERKLKEIIQSIRLTQDFSGEKGKQEIITAYLNQNYYGNQSYGVKAAVKSYFGIDLADIDPAQAAIIAGAAQVALELRPRPQRDRALRHGRRRSALTAAKSKLVVPTTPRWSSAANDDPRPAGRRRPDADVGRAVQLGRIQRREARGGRPRQPGDHALDRPALRLGGPRRAGRQAVR